MEEGENERRERRRGERNEGETFIATRAKHFFLNSYILDNKPHKNV
jgi:hypothetical protein